MSDIAIKIENLSKQYRLGLVGSRTLVHDMKRWWVTSILRKDDPNLKIGETNIQNSKSDSKYVWALRDINLEIKQGDVMGIIGKNGAGKSTLLKLLSRVTKPTTGTIKYMGRIASLLEVGTGFHPEMTGRENIFMNGSIMGMTKIEIKSKFDEIVDFAGVERYIDTPVKRYSSGMTVRLGFAIAAHLEPEILVVDEVLAVGDAEFQKKAIGKMQDVSTTKGRTVLFVSHNMGAVRDLCENAIILSNGTVFDSGKSNDMINRYLGSQRNIKTYREWNSLEGAPGNKDIRLRKLHLISEDRQLIYHGLTTRKIGFHIEYNVIREVPFFTHSINLYTLTGVHIFSSHDSNSYTADKKISKGTYNSNVWIPKNILQPGDYIISIGFIRYKPFEILFHENDLLQLKVVDTIDQSTKNSEYNLDLPGLVRPKLNWDKREKLH